MACETVTSAGGAYSAPVSARCSRADASIVCLFLHHALGNRRLDRAYILDQPVHELVPGAEVTLGPVGQRVELALDDLRDRGHLGVHLGRRDQLALSLFEAETLVLRLVVG